MAVIGDGATPAGMAYEAMNHTGHLKSRLFVVLNHNDKSIAPPVGAMQRHLNQMAAKVSLQVDETTLPGPMRPPGPLARICPRR